MASLELREGMTITSTTARHDKGGTVTQLHVTGRDITERRLAEKQLESQALELRRLSLRDELTGLYNRRGLFGSGQSGAELGASRPTTDRSRVRGLERHETYQSRAGTRPRPIDTAIVLTSALGESGVVARLGGDEFAIHAIDFIASQLEPLRSLSKDATLRLGPPYRLSLSVGAAIAEAG